jgi:LuxR family maltose regulon positive regulatory protein
VNYFLDHAPPNAHLVIGGRIDPPLSLASLRAGGKLLEIRPNDLRFTEEEVSVFLNDQIGLELSEEDISVLLTRTEGWITGLQLVALSLQYREDKHEFVTAFSGSHHYIIDYLVDEVMSRQTEDVQSFLRQTSILGRFNVSLCDSVLEITDSKTILNHLDESNLFLIPLDDERIWYRFHHLFTDFLNVRLREEEPQKIQELHQKAAKWLEQNKFVNEAIDHAIAGEDFEHAAQLVEHIGPEMMMKSEFDQLTTWLDALPQELVESWPWLCIIRAWMCQRWARLEEAENYLKGAEKGLADEATPEPVGGANVILGQVAAIRALIALNKNRPSQAIEFANQALDFLPEGHFNRPVAALALGIAKRANNDFDEANQVMVEAYRDSLEVGNRILAQAVLLEKGIMHERQGRLNQAAETYREAIQFQYEKTQIKIPYASESSIRLGNILREWNNLKTAREHLEEGIEIGKPAKMVDAVAIGHAIKARIHIAFGDLNMAINEIQKAEKYFLELPDLGSGTIVAILNCQTWVLIAQNKFDEAAHLFIENNPCAIDDINCFGEFEQAIWARILLYRGRENPSKEYLPQAQDLIEKMLDLSKQSRVVRTTIELLVLKALTLHAQSKLKEAVNPLEEALILAEPEGYIRTFIDEGEPLKELLLQVPANEKTGAYVRKIITAFDKRDFPEKSSTAQPLVDPLSERELDVLKLLATELSGPEIADELMVSLNTMRTHTKNIYAKLGVNNRRAAVNQAKELDLI